MRLPTVAGGTRSSTAPLPGPPVAPVPRCQPGSLLGTLGGHTAAPPHPPKYRIPGNFRLGHRPGRAGPLENPRCAWGCHCHPPGVSAMGKLRQEPAPTSRIWGGRGDSGTLRGEGLGRAGSGTLCDFIKNGDVRGRGPAPPRVSRCPRGGVGAAAEHGGAGGAPRALSPLSLLCHRRQQRHQRVRGLRVAPGTLRVSVTPGSSSVSPTLPQCHPITPGQAPSIPH